MPDHFFGTDQRRRRKKRSGRSLVESFEVSDLETIGIDPEDERENRENSLIFPEELVRLIEKDLQSQ